MQDCPTVPTAPPRRTGFWRQRILLPILRQFTQGVSPDQIAATLAVGAACSLFPIFGVTSLVNLGVGMSLRMNQPVLQALNQLLGPLQLALILVYIRIGEAICGSASRPFSLKDAMNAFHGSSLWEFARQFGAVGGHALAGWLITSPMLIGILYFSLRPGLRRIAARKA